MALGLLKNKPMNIDIVSKYFFPVTAGIETNIMETYKFLVEKGWHVTMHTSKDIYTEKDVLPESDKLKGIHIKRYSFSSFGYWPKIEWNTTDVVCLHNFDIFPHFQILLYCLFLKLIKKKRFALILTPHGGYNPTWKIYSFTQKTIKQSYNFLIGTFLINNIVDGIRAVSEWEKMEMMRKGINPKLIRIIANGIENEAYADVERETSLEVKNKVKKIGTYILQIGRIYAIKNYETTIKTLPMIPSHINFVILGPIADENYKHALIQLAKRLDVEKRLIFAGVIRGIDKYYVIKHAALMVHMAIWESFCNAVHEGMSQGLVCIVANNTALPLLIKNDKNGYLVNTHDNIMLAEKINYVLHNMHTPKIKKMIERNRAFGLENSWKSTAEKMDKFYTDLYKKI